MRSKGFVLVATLWLLVIMTLAVGFFTLWTQRAVAHAQAMQQDTQGMVDMQSTLASLLYLAATRHFSVAGLTVPPMQPVEAPVQAAEEIDPEVALVRKLFPSGGEIAPDDRPYFGIGDARFALQDERGLLNINYVSRRRLFRLLGLLGVEAELRDPLMDKLYDYVDRDDLYRLNGAEAPQYRDRGLPPPTNHILRTPQELRRVLGWAERNELWDKLLTLAQITTAVPTGIMLNFNTAPSLVLQSLEGVDAASAARVIADRRAYPLLSEVKLAESMGFALGLDPLETGFVASEYLRVTLWHSGGRHMRQIHLKLTPGADKQAPWRIQYALELPLLPAYQTEPVHVQTPVFAAAAAANPR